MNSCTTRSGGAALAEANHMNMESHDLARGNASLHALLAITNGGYCEVAVPISSFHEHLYPRNLPGRARDRLRELRARPNQAGPRLRIRHERGQEVDSRDGEGVEGRAPFLRPPEVS